MDKTEIILPIKIDSKLSLNSIYSGKKWYTRQNQACKIHQLVRTELINQRVPKKPVEKPVGIEFYWNSLLDLDNHGYVAKLIIDGLKGYLIKDDSKKYIREIYHAYWLGKGVKIVISDKSF